MKTRTDLILRMKKAHLLLWNLRSTTLVTDYLTDWLIYVFWGFFFFFFFWLVFVVVAVVVVLGGGVFFIII